MHEPAKILKFFAVFFLSSCAISQAIYLGPNIYARRTGPHDSAAGEITDINGIFPEAVYIKTRTQTFNTYHYYILSGGLIWYKSIDPGQEPRTWTLFGKTGLPHDPLKWGFSKTRAVAELSADADELVALSEEGNFYRYCFDRTIAHRSNVWLDRQGWPGEEQLHFDPRTARNLSWGIGKRNSHVLYYEDPFGNPHHNGTMEIVTTYVLLEDGQEICYADTGLPNDFSRNFTGPERGAFRAVSLSASASTMFVINEAGEMYTRLADFDTTGSDPMFFKYTYEPYRSDLPGTDYFSNLSEWGLPAEGWRPQPRIPLGGNAAVTRHITILQNGRGNAARELRVAGLDGEGRRGYWTKAIFADSWEFRRAPIFFGEDAVLRGAAPAGGEARGERGASPDKYYRGYRWNGGESEEGWQYEILNFNILEGDCDFRVSRSGESCLLKLHPVEMWSYLKRDYLPGRTGSPKIFFATLEIPEHALEGLSEDFAGELAEKFLGNDRKLFQYTIAASARYIIMQDADDKESLLFLTDGTLSDQYPEFRPLQCIENYEWTGRYFSRELTVDPAAPLTGEGLAEKIALNKRLLDELKFQIRALRWAGLTAFKFNAGYIPAHYFALITPLRFLDMPKIRTVTTFGDRIVLTNSAYVNAVSDIRIWLDEKIIALLEARLHVYQYLERELVKKASDAASSGAADLPSWYSDTISGYWDIAGLPRSVPGIFFGPGTGPSRRIPAVLSFVPPRTESEISGWYLRVGEPGSSPRPGGGFTVFVDPLESAGAICARRGRTPGEQRVRIDCVLYIDDTADTPVERDVIDGVFKPLFRPGRRGVRAVIRFDGRTFEIRERPARHGGRPLFRGGF